MELFQMCNTVQLNNARKPGDRHKEITVMRRKEICVECNVDFGAVFVLLS